MNHSPWSVPFNGFVYFLSHPRMWGHLFLGLFFSALSFSGSFAIGAFAFSHRSWFYAVGWGFFALLLDLIFLMPIILNFFFYRALLKEQKREADFLKPEGVFRAIFSSMIVFIRTLRWRILWPLFVLAALFFALPLVIPVSLMATSHLFALESADLVLSLRGYSVKKRVAWIEKHSWDLWRVAISSAGFAFLLSFLPLVGWFLWLPSIPVGLYRYIKKQESAII